MRNWTVGSRSRRKADLRLDDETVSGLHASLTRTDDGRWMVEDRNSTNGTARFVNGRWVSIKQAYVLPDERLRFGRAETTVRQLLGALRRRPDGPPSESTAPWKDDFIAAFSHILSFSELKKNLMFVLDIISAPAKHTLQCAVKNRPVNPFSFLIFGSIIFVMIAGFGLDLAEMVKAFSGGQIQNAGLLTELGAPLALLLSYNMATTVIPFFLFQYFALQKRSFDDFMRTMAVVNGFTLMLLSFLALIGTEVWKMAKIAETTQNASPALAGFAFMFYILIVLSGFYLACFNTVVLKHFWRITYLRAVSCALLAAAVMAIIIASPLVALFIVAYLLSF